MTLPPVDGDLMFEATGPSYTVGPRCANPNCSNWADHAHHLWRRSKTGNKPVDWIEITDYGVVGNKVGLCWRCHRDVTGSVGGYRAAIRLDRLNRVFQWCLVVEQHGVITDYPFAGLLDPQPPTPDSVALERATGQPESEACPTCGHIERARPSVPSSQRRARKSWIVLVPDDEQEHGAEVLDSLVEQLAPLIPNADASRTGRYYVLVPVLAYAAMAPHRFIETLTGVGA